MARPRKNDSHELIRLVDEYFTSEACGNPAKLKGSLLEAYASRCGSTAKSYDFRRDPAVTAHIEYLKKLVTDENGIRVMNGSAYKTLDTMALLRKFHDPDSLIKALSELDAHWKSVYEASCDADAGYRKCRAELSSCRTELEEKEACITDLSSKNRGLSSDNNRLIKENRYLRSMLRTYLYPALANSILREEHVLQGGTEELAEDMASVLMDDRFPRSVSESVRPDQAMRSREEALLERMQGMLDGGAHE